MRSLKFITKDGQNRQIKFDDCGWYARKKTVTIAQVVQLIVKNGGRLTGKRQLRKYGKTSPMVYTGEAPRPA